MNAFEEGYSFFEKNAGVIHSEYISKEYVGAIEKIVFEGIDKLNTLENNNKSAAILKGNLAETWHGFTYNTNAALEGSSSRVNVEEKNSFASVDISSDFADYSLKYYADGPKSAKEQATTFFERFNASKEDDFYKFLRARKYAELDEYMHKPIYEGQKRLVPSDQLEEAKKWLREKIEKEEANRPELAQHYRDTLDMLCDRIDNGEGIQSKPLSKARAEELTRLAKEGKIDAEMLNMTPAELITYKHILRQAFKAGKSSAIISIVLRVAPELLKAFSYLIENGAISVDNFKDIGFAACEGGVQGFFCGSISAAITIACESGKLGVTMAEISPNIIGTITVLVYNTMVNSFKVARGQMTRQELTNEFVKQMIISGYSVLGGTITQSLIGNPVLGIMLGSFIGSTIGAFTYDCGYSAVLSFCIDTGFTMFGLVEQDYRLPNEALERLGIDLFEYEKCEYDRCEYDRCIYDKCEYDRCQIDEYEITPLRRGVIAVNRIGYV